MVGGFRNRLKRRSPLATFIDLYNHGSDCSKVRRAELMLLSEIKAGRLPRDFKAKLVKTTTAIGQKSAFEQSCVRRDRFHDVLGYFPEKLKGDTAPDKLVNWLDGEGAEQTGVTMDRHSDIDAALQPEVVQFYCRTETCIVEYHLRPEEHVKKEQAQINWTRNVDSRSYIKELRLV